MEPKKKLKYEGIVILLVFYGLLAFIGFCLFNSATDGRLFADTLECPDGTWKVHAVGYTSSDDNWQIQPDGSYAKCVCYVPDPSYIDLGDGLSVYLDDLCDNSSNTTKNENSNNTTYKITFSIDDELHPVDNNTPDINGLKIIDHGTTHVIQSFNPPPPKNGVYPTLTIDEFNCTGFDCITWEYRE